MRAPLSWLKDFAPIEGEAGFLAEKLSNLGLVVDGIDTFSGAALAGVVVARVLDLRAHPNADKIQLVDVDSGDGEALQICCGAFNMSVGDLVPLATLGTIMPGGLEIARRKLRGEWSNGMLCSPAELDMPAAGIDGILILAPGLAQPGTPVAEALGVTDDVVFDLDISPNRPDALSMMGVARDLAAVLRLPFSVPEVGPVIAAGAVESAHVEVRDPALCPRFAATVVSGITVGSSPTWMARRLTLAGMRSINNVVDASNYIMLDIGQPNHAYDLDRLGGRGLIVRAASEGEVLVTLDGMERKMSAGDLLICDGTSMPVGLAGIMGGASSEISPTTTTVLVEAAYFAPISISRTGKRLGLSSEARHRFERGCNPELAPLVADRFVGLLPGAVKGPAVDELSAEHMPARISIGLRTARVNRVLGTDLDSIRISELIGATGFTTSSTSTGDSAATVEVEVPSWRPDVTREIDLVEEVARLHGYERISKTLPDAPRTGGGLNDYQRARRIVREILVGAGIFEAWTTTFLAPEDLGTAGLDTAAVTVANPLDRSESVLRTALLPGLAKAVRFNLDRQAPAVRLFEIGHVFAPPLAGEVTPDEREDLAVILAGGDVDAKAAAQVWSTVVAGLGLEGVKLVNGAGGGLHPGRSARIVGPDGRDLGCLGEIDPSVAAAFGLAGRVGYLSVDLARLVAVPRPSFRYRAVSRYPASDFDLAFVVPDTVPAAAVGGALAGGGGELIEFLGLFDVYRGESLPSGSRSLAYRVRLRADDRTLNEAELAQVRAAMIAAVSTLGGSLRS